MSSSQPPSRRTADPAQTRNELERLRPGMLARYDAALPGARAAILSRLLGAIAREPLPGLTGRAHGTATFAPAGRNPREPDSPRGAARNTDAPITVSFPADAAVAFAQAAAGLAVTVHDGQRLDDPATLVRLLWGDVPLAAEIDNSVANLALARAGNPAGELPRAGSRGATTPADERPTSAGNPAGELPRAGSRGATPPDERPTSAATHAGEPPRPGSHGATTPADERDLPRDLGRIEQLVIDGHPLHPCCRTRGGMTVDDVLTYAPEHSPVIRLRRLRVPENRWSGTAPPLLYAHPWQVEHLRDRYPWLTDAGETEPGRPLMSLRTIALGEKHLKTAIDVQMTSAVRTVSPAAVTNGPLLSALLEKLTADLPISVLAETAGGAVIVDGEPQRHLAYLERQAPAVAGDELVVPLAAMAASPLLLATVNDPYEWWGLLSERLFAPLVTVLDRGVALEAHGQNTLVVLKNHLPHRILYRDFGGVRVSPKRLRSQAPPLQGDLPSDDPAELRTKLAASALSNAAADLVAAFTRHLGADPARLWRQTAEAIKNTGTADVAHLLRDPLPIKATTAMRLAGHPLDDLWAYLDNPLAAV